MTNWAKFLEMGVLAHLTCLLRNLRQQLNQTWNNRLYQIGKGVCQGCILSLCLFNFYVEYIMRNVRLDKAQAGIKIVRRNINNLSYADDTTLMAENEEELKSLLNEGKRGE